VIGLRVDRLGAGQFLGVRLDQVGEPEQHSFALGRGEPAPLAAVEGGPGRADRAVDVVGPAGGHPGDHLTGGRRERVEGGAVEGVDELPVDESARADGLRQGHSSLRCG
jgi:hypothetical protein